MSIKNKLVLLIFAFILCLSCFFLFFFDRSAQVVLQESLSQEVQRIQEALVDLWGKEEKRLVEQVEDYAHWTDMGEKGVRGRDGQWLTENLYPWVGEQFGYEVALFTEAKEVIVASPKWEVPLENLGGAPWVGVYGDGERLYLAAFEPVTDNSGKTSYGAILGFAQPLHGGVFDAWGKALGGRIHYRFAGKTFLGKPSWEVLPDFRYEQGKLLARVAFAGGEKELWGEFQIEREYAGPLRIYNAVRRVFLFALLFSVLLAFF
ncbi:MAG: CHASE4 domain-containing protein [Candidatus Caldatribacteriaceae bacterium]